jgi:predicted Zn-dependent protease
MLYLMQGRRELVPTDGLDRVLKENPSHRDTIFWRAILAYLDGDNAAVRRLTTGILEREPLWGPPRTFLGDVLRTQGDVQGAIREQLKVLEQAPDNISAIRFLVHAYMDAGDPESAQRLLESKRAAFTKNYIWRLTWALLMARGNQRAEALATLDEDTLKFAGAAFVVTLDAAECYALLGDVSKAVEWLDRAVRNGDERLDWFRRNPRLAEIREDPRFQRIIESVEIRQKTRKRS